MVLLTSTFPLFKKLFKRAQFAGPPVWSPGVLQTSTRGAQSCSWQLRAEGASSDLCNQQVQTMPKVSQRVCSENDLASTSTHAPFCFLQLIPISQKEIIDDTWHAVKRGRKGDKKAGECSKKSSFRTHSPAVLYPTSLWFPSWSQTAKHQRGRGKVALGNLSWALVLDLQCSGK